MRNVAVLLLLISPVSAFSQKQEVMAKLQEYGIVEEFLISSLQDHDAPHSFDIKTNVNDGTKDLIEIGLFNPELLVGKRWTHESINRCCIIELLQDNVTLFK